MCIGVQSAAWVTVDASVSAKAELLNVRPVLYQQAPRYRFYAVTSQPSGLQPARVHYGAVSMAVLAIPSMDSDSSSAVQHLKAELTWDQQVHQHPLHRERSSGRHMVHALLAEAGSEGVSGAGLFRSVALQLTSSVAVASFCRAS